jgi:hypothetical protein
MKKIPEQSLVFAGAVILSLIARNLLLAPVLSPHTLAARVDLVREDPILEQVVE